MTSIQGKEPRISGDEDEDDLTRQLEDSFPASDPPSMTQPKAKAGAPPKHESVGSGTEKKMADQTKKQADQQGDQRK
ncbi:MAG: hypothetical protein JWN93_2094 [Hyphomicrobiales bacterium]|nr:hypothetical protein [Hyphomicrobiales bacterium]